MKLCRQCAIEKNVDAFGKDKSKSDLKKSICKECTKKNNAKWSLLNRDKKLKLMLDWKSKNKEKLKIYNQQWYANNSDRCRKVRRIWLVENREHVLLMNQNRRARIKSSGGTLSKNIIQKLLKLQKGKCPCCGNPLGDKFHVDHVIPIALGGKNIDSNVQLLKGTCNQKKGSKHPIDYMRAKGFLL